VAHEIVGAWQSSGDDINYWLFSLTTQDTQDLESGTYQLIQRWVGSGTYNGREETVAQTVVSVLTNPRTADAGDLQSHAERALAIIEAALEGRLTADIENYQIGGRAVSKIPAKELMSLRRAYQAEVDSQRTGSLGVPVVTRFTRVG
jgi:hypothetical protein